MITRRNVLKAASAVPFFSLPSFCFAKSNKKQLTIDEYVQELNKILSSFGDNSINIPLDGVDIPSQDLPKQRYVDYLEPGQLARYTANFDEERTNSHVVTYFPIRENGEVPGMGEGVELGCAYYWEANSFYKKENEEFFIPTWNYSYSLQFNPDANVENDARRIASVFDKYESDIYSRLKRHRRHLGDFIIVTVIRQKLIAIPVPESSEIIVYLEAGYFMVEE